MLNPFVRQDLDILFVGLNPANTSNRKGHYFSTNPALWNQFYASGIITKQVNMDIADEIVFGTNSINHNGMQYGITDLITNVAESNSSVVKPSLQNCMDLEKTITELKPRCVVILHSKVIQYFVQRYLGMNNVKYGCLGKIISGCDTVFYNIPFPHGNNIPSDKKVDIYKKLIFDIDCGNV